jgi:glycylpeptide N-tetradecanoyltransferase
MSKDLQKINKVEDIFNANNLNETQRDILVSFMKSGIRYPINEQQSEIWNYKYWKNQPVKLNKKQMLVSRSIQDKLELEDVNIASIYELVDIDLNNDTEMNTVSEFLKSNYIENLTNKFRTVYSKDLIKWSIGSTGLIIGLKLKYNGILVGTIASNIIKTQIKNKVVELGNINYLCIDSRIRQKGYAEKLMTEMKNRLINNGYNSAIFSTDRYVPTPIIRMRQFHRPLNYEKIANLSYAEVNKNSLSGTDKDTILSDLIDKYKITQKMPSNIIKMDLSHIEQCYKLYNSYMDRYDLHNIYTLAEFINIFSNSDLVSTYVVLGTNDKVKDFFSFYKTESIKSNTTVKCANMLIYTLKGLDYTVRKIMDYMAIAAHTEGMDVLNGTDQMENKELFGDPNNEFLPDDYLYYNLYNWECPQLLLGQVCKSVI